MSTKQAIALPPVRFSRLRLMAKSAAHYAEGYGEETGPMRKGTALHAFLLGRKEKIAVFENGVRNAKSEKWIEFQAKNAGKTILIPSEFEVADKMRRSVERHERAMELLDGAQEQTITWDFAGRKCQGTPDNVRLVQGAKSVTELKACFTSAPELLKWHAKKMAYHGQVAWYSDGLERTMQYAPGPVESHYIVAVEMTPPFPVTVLDLRPSMILAGRKQWRRWFEQLMNCEQSQHFPAYVEGDVDWEDEERDDALDWEDEEAA